jgi:SAM-dependent methyltransferase
MSSAAELWSGGEYELVAKRFAEIHDGLVRRLAPARGERWLDVATGTGEVAVRAAEAGAAVTGLDIAPRLLEQARARSSEVEWVEGDAERLPFEDAAFDVVSSAFGVIFAPRQKTAAAELARVCRGRLGLTAWRPGTGPHAVYAAFGGDDPLEGSPDDWGREEHVQELLGDEFELEFEEQVWLLEGDTPESLWELMSVGAPPVKAFYDALEPGRRDDFREAMIDHWEQFRTNKGISEPRSYFLIAGRRR